MDKMRMESVNVTKQNIEKIAEIFPNVITEKKCSGGGTNK